MKLVRGSRQWTLNTIVTASILAFLIQSTVAQKASANIDNNNDDDNDVISDSSNHNHRAKRTTYRTTNFYPYGIVPYIYNDNVSRIQRNIIRRMIEHYQNLTCIRFVPRVSSDGQWARDLYNLGHDGYVEFIQQDHCFGGMGNNGGKTLVSCCGRESCKHELGHALGLVHEHQNPGSVGFLRINYNKIQQPQKVRYKIAMESEVVPGYPFDMSSPMAYPYRADVTVLTPDISLDTKDFYMFKEISDNHQCPQNNCSNFAMECVNDGYVTMIQGVCACRCPEGLNPQTGCATVFSNDRLENKCGAVYELNAGNPTVNFNKPTNQHEDCTWLINAPEGDTIVLDFHVFNIPKQHRECADHVDIRLAKIGQGGKRFCGTEPPVMIRSYFNRLMLTFNPARQSSGSTFNVTAKLVSDDSLCYKSSDKGFSYRGTVNFDRNYVKCVNWSDAVHCPHNPYRYSDMSAGLDSNYCRNPGDGTRPWCYVFAHTCRRRYCDVCHVDPPFNKDPPRACRALKSSFYNLCRHGTDTEKYRCAKTCREELLPPRPSVSTITCSRPPSMSDSRQVNKRRQESFAVGESVTFQCRHPNRLARTELKKYCLTNGEWSEGQTACLPCHKEEGYVLYHEHCYKIETERKTANQHQETCQSFAGDLADVRTLEEQKFITDLGFELGASSLYIGAHDMYEEGTFRFRDHSLVHWAPWHYMNQNTPGVDCVTSTPNNEWYALACNEKMKAVCKVNMLYHARRGGRRCSDSRDDCAALLAQDPEMCTRDYGSFAFTQCPRTCSKCFNFQFNVL